MEIIFLGLLYKLTQHQMKTEGQGPDLITTDQQNFLRIYQWEDTLRNKRRFLPCYSSKISCSYLSFDVLPVIHHVSPSIWLMESTPPESDRHRHYLASGIFSMYAKWNAPTNVLIVIWRDTRERGPFLDPETGTELYDRRQKFPNGSSYVNT